MKFWTFLRMPTIALPTLRWGIAATPGGVSVQRINHHAAIGPHDHVFHEIVFIEAGTAEHHTVDGVRMLRPGDIIILRPLTWHSYQQTRHLTLINCLIDRRLMNRLMLLLRDEAGVFDLFTRPLKRPRQTPPLVVHALPAESQICIERLQTIMTEERHQLAAWEAMATGALLEFLTLVVRLHARVHPRETVRLPDRAQKAVFDTVVWLEQNPRTRDSLRELAGKAHLSAGHLSRNFRKRMGMGITEYRNRIRIEEACRLLAHTDLKVSDVASRVGYNEIAYFSRCFRSMVGQMPRKYRAAARRGGA
jgi:AraC-like DNA-binding protein